MMWIALLIALLLSLGALAYVVWPLLKPGPAPVIVEDDRLTELLGRKDAVMLAIKELEFDYHVGKLSEEDYQLYDGRLRRQAMGLLQQIEQMAPLSAQMDATLEAEIARRRRVAEPAPAGARQPVAPAVAVAAGPAPARVQTAAANTTASPAASTVPINGNGSAKPRFCTNCGNRLETHHKFCANCGAPAGV
jgi:hypothetical protein